MLVVWICNQGEACVNTDEPGKHRGDTGYEDAEECRTGIRPNVTIALKFPEL